MLSNADFEGAPGAQCTPSCVLVKVYPEGFGKDKAMYNATKVFTYINKRASEERTFLTRARLTNDISFMKHFMSEEEVR